MSKTKDAGQQMLSEADQAELLKLPLHTPKEIQSYLKPGEGFERVGPVALNLLGRHPEIAAALKLDLAALKDELGRAAHLAPRQHFSRASIVPRLGRSGLVCREFGEVLTANNPETNLLWSAIA